MKNHLFLFFITLITIGCSTPEPTVTDPLVDLSNSQMLEDYNLFQNIYQSANAGLYKYHTKEEINQKFADGRMKISSNTSYREFYNILWEVIDFSGSCHSYLEYPEDRDKFLSAQNIFFPVPLVVIEGMLRSNGSFYSIPTGAVISSVNGMKHDQLLSAVSTYCSTDGMNTTGKEAFINSDWLAFYFYLAMGAQEKFDISYLDHDGSEKTVSVGALSYTECSMNFSSRHSAGMEDEFYSEDYSYRYNNLVKSGILTVRTFAMGGPNSEGHAAYASFLDSVFLVLKNESVPNLIVDVRGNGGGNDPNDLLLYSYLTERPFKENVSAFTHFNEVPYSENFIEEYENERLELQAELAEEHSVFKDGRYYQNPSWNPMWEPNELTFNGEVYMLIDPLVASAASLFSSLMKSDGITVIGEETLGGYYGHTGHIPVGYELTHSKLILTFSLVDIEQDVKRMSDQHLGEGVMPTIEVVPSVKDFLDNEDTQLKYALNLITTQQ